MSDRDYYDNAMLRQCCCRGAGMSNQRQHTQRTPVQLFIVVDDSTLGNRSMGAGAGTNQVSDNNSGASSLNGLENGRPNSAVQHTRESMVNARHTFQTYMADS